MGCYFARRMASPYQRGGASRDWRWRGLGHAGAYGWRHRVRCRKCSSTIDVSVWRGAVCRENCDAADRWCDGHRGCVRRRKERIAAGATAVAASGEITEDRLAAALSAPAPNEPDLVIVLGPATQMPASLVWELAYAELVFFDADWHALDAEHLEMAIDDFTRRDRRFGGVDS